MTDVHMANEYKCSWRLVISILIKLGKTLIQCLNVCKHDKFVHFNVEFLYVPINLVYRFNKAVVEE